ncbi:MAG TPA: hypothetical protein VFM37_13250, partial [Pseudonocardiaceae bacterium]|nr:hypothetical protein [Pseudonocardiaceae bacterium]
YMIPDPQVVYKTVRPIVPTGMKKLVRLDDLDFTVKVENGDDGRIHVEKSALEEKEDFLLVGLHFVPVLTCPFRVPLACGSALRGLSGLVA